MGRLGTKTLSNLLKLVLISAFLVSCSSDGVSTRKEQGLILEIKECVEKIPQPEGVVSPEVTPELIRLLRKLDALENYSFVMIDGLGSNPQEIAGSLVGNPWYRMVVVEERGSLMCVISDKQLKALLHQIIVSGKQPIVHYGMFDDMFGVMEAMGK